jgi:hypothetical protein
MAKGACAAHIDKNSAAWTEQFPGWVA